MRKEILKEFVPALLVDRECSYGRYIVQTNHSRGGDEQLSNVASNLGSNQKINVEKEE